MSERKIDLMHRMFGTSEGKCKDCKHFVRYKYHDRLYRKCAVYGITNSESSDWLSSYRPCGLYPDKDTVHTDIIKMVKREKKKDNEQIDGQLSLFGVDND